MDITLTVSSVNVDYSSSRQKVDAELTDVSIDDVVDAVGGFEVVLDDIGIDACKKHFDLIDNEE